MENNIPETEQWKLDGDCDKCRRNNYCTHVCKKFKMAEMDLMRDIWSSAYKNAKKRVDDMKRGEETIEKDE